MWSAHNHTPSVQSSSVTWQKWCSIIEFIYRNLNKFIPNTTTIELHTSPLDYTNFCHNLLRQGVHWCRSTIAKIVLLVLLYIVVILQEYNLLDKSLIDMISLKKRKRNLNNIETSLKHKYLQTRLTCCSSITWIYIDWSILKHASTWVSQKIWYRICELPPPRIPWLQSKAEFGSLISRKSLWNS